MPSLDFDRALRIVGTLGAILSFLWGVWVWRENSAREREAASRESARLAETRRIEATKPFLDRQLKLYTEASQVAAALATAEDGGERKKAAERFWLLYWGELALVEDREVETAMVALGRALSSSAPRDELQQASLKLSHACRASLDRSWGIKVWTAGSSRQ